MPKNRDGLQKGREFIVKISKWENSLSQTLLKEARNEILDANGGRKPRVLDPFAGGGSLPLEAIRLGCETYAADYNPVATLLLKCTLEYPQRYGAGQKTEEGLAVTAHDNRLLNDVRRWGTFVLQESTKEIGTFFPERKHGAIPVGYIWARTVPCQNPSCNAEIPLMRQYWLAKKDNKKITLYPYTSKKQIRFKILGTGHEKMQANFNPDEGSISRAVATCPACKSVVDGDTIRTLFAHGKCREKMIVAIFHKDGNGGKQYRLADEEDEVVFHETEAFLALKRKEYMTEWGLDPIPDEPVPPKDSHRAVGSQLPLYNFRTWGDLFNSRQKLVLMVFVGKVRAAHRRMLQDGYEREYAKAVATYLAMGVDRLVDYNSGLTRWVPLGEFVGNTFGRQALPMVWDHFELCPFSGASGDWHSALNWISKVIEHLCFASGSPARITQSSATSLSYPEGFFDAVLTDPPYYDNIPYSYLSDFFYVWLKRSVGEMYPDLFTSPLTPKSDEIVVYQNMKGGGEGAKQFFEERLRKSFEEIHRVLKPNGIAVIIYAHKSTAGWETLINSLLDSGLVVTAAWPIHTERKGRLTARETASLASSIYMVARKFGREQTGFYKDVRGALKKHLDIRLDALWREEIGGADFFIAAIGSSMEVFGKYNRIIDDEGRVIRADRFLEDIRKIVTDYAVRQVLHDGFAGEITAATRFYVLWRWAYGEAKLEFDDADKLAKGVGIDLPEEWNKGFIEKDGQIIQMLGPEDRNERQLESSKELVDVLHHVLLLWKKGRNEDILKALTETGFGKSDVFYRVAQAISESLPNESKEKKLLEGFLQARGRISEIIRKESEQKRLFE